MWALYVFVVISVLSLWNYSEKSCLLLRHRLLISSFGRTRFLIVVYAIGRPVSQLTSSVDAQVYK
jgi:hypothetical protein